MADLVERKIGDLTVAIDRASCISSGNCVKVAPGLFALDDDSLCTWAPQAGDADHADVIEACRICPVDALIVKNAAGECIVP